MWCCASLFSGAGFREREGGGGGGDSNKHVGEMMGRRVVRALLTVTIEPPALMSTTVPDYGTTSNVSTNPNAAPMRKCTRPAILEFPSDGFTRAQRQHGWFLLHVALACYCFWLLAIVCDDYFVPAIESLCSSKLLLYTVVDSASPPGCLIILCFLVGVNMYDA